MRRLTSLLAIPDVETTLFVVLDIHALDRSSSRGPATVGDPVGAGPHKPSEGSGWREARGGSAGERSASAVR